MTSMILVYSLCGAGFFIGGMLMPSLRVTTDVQHAIMDATAMLVGGIWMATSMFAAFSGMLVKDEKKKNA